MSKPTLPDKRREYLDLMQAWLTGSLWHDGTCAPFAAPDYDAARREHGLDWPAEALTMIGVKRLANLRHLTQAIIADGVPGDLIETGVWRGGACIMMRAILFAYGVTDKRVWVADSFAGLPPGDPSKCPLDADSDFHTYEQLAIPMSEVQEHFKTFGFLDDQTVFLPGWFRDTLSDATIDRLALLRLDGDMYESTLDALNALYPKLTEGGFVIIDDYHVVPACRSAVHDYCAKHRVHPDLTEIDGVGVFWRKGVAAESNSLADIEDTGAEDDDLIERILLATASLRKMAVERMARSLARQDERIGNYLQDLSNLKKDIAQRDADIAQRDADIAQRDADIAQRDADIAQRDADIAQRDAELAAIRASTSWRITRPLRDLKQLTRTVLPARK